MSDDIKAGDVVECIYAEGTMLNPYLKVGGIYRVAAIFMGVDGCGQPGVGLKLRDNPAPDPWLGFAAELFRKLPPASEEFAADMRACRPADERIAA